MVPPHKDNRENICPICLEPLKEPVSTDCRHHFCRGCLTQHVEKASGSGILRCPVCRKPCSEGVLGEDYICYRHQKRVHSFCEISKCLLCVDCLKAPEHQSHLEPTIENAISHYKERLNRRSRKLRKDLGDLQRLKAQKEERLQALQVDWRSHRLKAELKSQDQTKGQLQDHPQQQLDQQEDLPAEVAKILDLTEAATQFSVLVADVERRAKELDAGTLKDASDLLNRSAPKKLEGLLSHLLPTSPTFS
ncbi:tripartite motif-containing protein 40 [Nannospalax galili]|uniref:Tripartite motif-containing 40 n=1 Tax=Nannospalax galili TaxID=1026970 RepID=A0A8C6RUY9_NANGA|nr:tripartite motif-containing protein 40 [Nannospalax galili]